MRDDYLRTAFDMFDKDKSGKIDKSELMGLLQGEEMGNIVDAQTLIKYIEEVDNNGDGEIDFEEF